MHKKINYLYQVKDFVSKKLNVIPSHVFCIAGGAAEEIGLFADISSQQIISCFQKNYFTAVFLANAMIKLWVSRPQQKQARHLVFTNSTACFMALPGYGAYTPTKTAIRALADTLRQEVIMYESIVDIRIHCSFPGTILTEAFTREQEIKPEILKLIEGTDDTTHAQTAEQVAKAIISGVDNGHFFIPTDTQTRLLLNNMRGPSPAQTYVVDWLMTLIGMIVWPFYRMFFDYTVRQYGKKKIKPPSE